MNYDELKKLVDLNLTQREIAIKLNTSHSNIRYWLLKHKLKTQYSDRSHVNKTTHCSLCGNEIKNNVNNRSRCQSCTTRIRRYRTKIRAVEYLGGKCIRCGWSGNVAALEFHHNNDDKIFAIGSASNKSWKFIVTELQKCELLCSNCHRIEHTKFNKDVNFMNAVLNYNKR